MRILHLVNRIDESGDGITNVTIDLAVEQRKLGHDVTVGSTGGSYEALLLQHGVRFVLLNFRNRHPVATLKVRAALRSVVNDLKPDVIHVHTMTSAVLAASMVGKPPVVATVHNEYQKGAWLMGLADAVVGVSKAVTEAMVARGVSRRRMHTVLNGTIGSPRRLPAEGLPSPSISSPSVVSLGAVSHRKGADVLLDAFELVVQQVPEAHLYYIGHQDWSEFVYDAGRRGCASHVHFVGFVAQPQAYLKAADVFVLASRREPLGLVLLEALEAGCAIVGSDVDGIPEALANGDAGLLSETENPADFAINILRVLREPALARELRDKAREHAKIFTVARMTNEYLALYKSLESERTAGDQLQHRWNFRDLRRGRSWAPRNFSDQVSWVHVLRNYWRRTQ